MMSEVEFLMLYAEEGTTVVYAGAAPGTHISFLSRMFPEVSFVLIDPAEFSVCPTDRIILRNEFMTDDVR
jgi:fibrillarin-like rRNA methylase